MYVICFINTYFVVAVVTDVTVAVVVGTDVVVGVTVAVVVTDVVTVDLGGAAAMCEYKLP